MADYWKSQPRKFCQYCKCWIADNKPSIEFHERGKNHKENVAAKISEIKKKSVQKAKQENRMCKQFAAMEEAALKAYEEDLKRLEKESSPSVPTTALPKPKPPPIILCEPPPHKNYQKKSQKTKKPAGEQTQTWVEGWTHDGHMYYYNTASGESQWDRPEGFLGSSYFVQAEQYKSSAGSAWMEGVSPEGYTYWYHTQTGESRWEKPIDLPTNETPESNLASGSEKVLKEADKSENEAQLGSEVAEQPILQSTDPENTSRKRKADGDISGKSDDDETNMPQEDVEEKKQEDLNVTSEAEVEKTEDVAKAKRPKSLNPYGAWEQIKEEKDPYANVDLQLPQVAVEEIAPTELPPEPKPKFKERIITSLGVPGGPTSFKKSKTQNGKSRSFRQRDNDD
ncbi:WW domain-binding protein 4 [Corythoichthys intestinalis]|uniref:WW domain-binding protein 4 n=1 Tax=Corythoichthys intestinalis TaxID=161448 RepID=UPI0025A62836|nr:WW domain-binding protein 4 [Corythoichthys intestinalis]